jgi:hypothetical protein
VAVTQARNRRGETCQANGAYPTCHSKGMWSSLDSSADYVTNLPDLGNVAFDELRYAYQDQLAPFLSEMLRQVACPRFNLGDSGPPGRVD